MSKSKKEVQQAAMQQESAAENKTERNPQELSSIEELAKKVSEEQGSPSEATNGAQSSEHDSDGINAEQMTPNSDSEGDKEEGDDNEDQADIIFTSCKFPAIKSRSASIKLFLEKLEQDLASPEKCRLVKREFPEFDPLALDFAKGSILAKDESGADESEEAQVESVKWAISQISSNKNTKE